MSIDKKGHIAPNQQLDLQLFVEQLKKLRRMNRLSQTQLANLVDHHHSYISRLEAGQRLPSRQFVLDLASSLKLDELQTSQLLISAGFVESHMQKMLLQNPVLLQHLSSLAKELESNRRVG